MAQQVDEAMIREKAELLFAQIDTNQNGALELNEVREFSRGIFLQVSPNGNFDEAKFQETFNAMDKNNDGKVSKEELF